MSMARLKINPRFITDSEGNRTEAVLDIHEFSKLCDLLEDQLDLEAFERDRRAESAHIGQGLG